MGKIPIEEQVAEEREILDELSFGRSRPSDHIADGDQCKTARGAIAAECPCCKYWFEVGDREIKKHLLRRQLKWVSRKGYRIMSNWLKSTWGMNVKSPSIYTSSPTSPSLGRIFQSGDSRSMSFIAQCCEDAEVGPPIVIAWRSSGKTFGDNWFCCPIGNLVEVIRRLAKDAPEFKKRLLKALGAKRLEDELPIEEQSLGAGFDDSFTRRI